MKEHPIIFSTEMVKAILEGRKTQTRRVVKTGDSKTAKYFDPRLNGWPIYQHNGKPVPCPYGQAGDRLWVREAFYIGPYSPGLSAFVTYKADGETREVSVPIDANVMLPGNHPSIHLPRWASRITLEIKEVRVERVQEISPDDCAAEGLAAWMPESNLKATFQRLWDSINTKRGYGWSVNPWCWCITFEVLK